MGAINCWQFKNCGREPDGAKTDSLGVCPAATLVVADGFLGGVNGGRACAYITGTFCGGKIQGTHKDKEKHCGSCDFYKELKKEHGSGASVMKFDAHVGSRS